MRRNFILGLNKKIKIFWHKQEELHDYNFCIYFCLSGILTHWCFDTLEMYGVHNIRKPFLPASKAE